MLRGILQLALDKVGDRVTHGVEFFAGVKTIMRGMCAFDYPFKSFEINDNDNNQDINSRAGFINAVAFVLSCIPFGFIWCAVVCSTWVFMSKSSTGRHIHPLGYGGSITCHYANVMVQRVCMLLELATSMQVHWVVEQPRSSTLHEHPRWELMAERHAIIWSIRCINTFMGAFMGDSEKGPEALDNSPVG